MGERSPELDIGKLGRYLRRVRESRRLSLDAVAEMTLGFPGRVTKSHLSRIENGQAEPTFPKMYALSQVYGLPIATMAETFEVDQRRKTMSRGLATVGSDRLYDEACRMRIEGRYAEALVRIELLLDRRLDADADRAGQPTLFELSVRQISCLVALDRYSMAKEACEEMLATSGLTADQRVVLLFHFAKCCSRLGRFTIASMAVDHAERDLAALDDPRPMRAQLLGLKGELCSLLGDTAGSVVAFREALEAFTQLADPFEACRHRMSFGVALTESGKYREARRQLTLALKEARTATYDRQTVYALHNLGTLSLLEGDERGAEAFLLESNALARERQYTVAVFCNCYYLLQIAESRGDPGAVRSHRGTLRAYAGRVPDTVREAREFRRRELTQPGEEA